jgi:BirA family biotin operon repressor/biotin-[acetyl-CoA-carboxylase] ligase
MPEPTMHWGAEALWRQLEPLLPGLGIEVLHSVGSTNSALLSRARVSPGVEVAHGDVQVRRSVESAAFGRRAADAAPCLLVAEHQTAGRGRQGRHWQSEPGASLTFSLGVPLAPRDWSGLSLAVGVALCEAIDAMRMPGSSAPRLGLKWPNDLWLGAPGEGGRKLGGVLIETVAAGTQRLAVVGVGINVRPFDADGLSSGFACVQELDPSATAPALLARIALPLVEALRLFEAQGFAAFAERFAARDLLAGRSVQTTSAAVPEGLALGVSAQGALRVRTPQGAEREIASGEVSVRAADTGAGGL